VCLIVGDCSQAKTHTIWRQISGTFCLQELSGSSSGRDAIRYAEELLTEGSLHGEWARRSGWSTKTIGTLHGARRRRRRRGEMFVVVVVFGGGGGGGSSVNGGCRRITRE